MRCHGFSARTLSIKGSAALCALALFACAPQADEQFVLRHGRLVIDTSAVELKQPGNTLLQRVRHANTEDSVMRTLRKIAGDGWQVDSTWSCQKHKAKGRFEQRIECSIVRGDTVNWIVRGQGGHAMVAATQFFIAPNQFYHVANSIHERIALAFGKGADCRQETDTTRLYQSFWQWHWQGQTIFMAASLAESTSPPLHGSAGVSLEVRAGFHTCSEFVDPPFSDNFDR